MRIYDVALGQTEIQTDMDTPVAVPEAAALQQLGAGVLTLGLLARRRGRLRRTRASTRVAPKP